MKDWDRYKGLVRDRGAIPLGRQTLPDYLKRSLHNIELTPEQLLDNGRNFLTCLINWQQTTEVRKREKEIRKAQPPHVGRVQNDRAHALLEKMVMTMEYPGDQMVANSNNGTPTEGDLQRIPGYKKSEPYVKEHIRQKGDGLRTRPPSWMSKTECSTLFQEFLARINGTGDEEIDEAQAKTVDVTYIFGAVSGGKQRCIADARPANAKSMRYEKMQMRAHPTLLAVLKAVVNGQADRTDDLSPLVQRRKDVSQDIRHAQGVGEQENIPFPPPPCGREGPFQPTIPCIAKSDFSGYFWQSAVKCKWQNCHAIFDPEQKKYRYFLLSPTQFGNLHSLFQCCALSEWLCFTLVCYLRLVAQIYVDDTILVAGRRALPISLALTTCLYGILGLKVNFQKTLEQAKNTVFGVLGIGYIWREIGMQVVPMDGKRQQIAQEAQELRRQIGEKSLDVKTLQKFLGNIVWAMYLYKGTLDPVRKLHKWLQPTYWANNIKRTKERENLGNLINKLARTVLLAPPVDIVRDAKGRWDIYTDAALEWQQPQIGGVVARNGNMKVAFADKQWVQGAATRLAEATGGNPIKSEIIYIYELIGVWAGALLGAKLPEGSKIVFNVDNTAAIYALIAGQAESPVASFIIRETLALLKGKSVYFLYCKSQDNVADCLTREDKYEIVGAIPRLNPNWIERKGAALEAAAYSYAAGNSPQHSAGRSEGPPAQSEAQKCSAKTRQRGTEEGPPPKRCRIISSGERRSGHVEQ